jgi:hypothetical protein
MTGEDRERVDNSPCKESPGTPLQFCLIQTGVLNYSLCVLQNKVHQIKAHLASLAPPPVPLGIG